MPENSETPTISPLVESQKSKRNSKKILLFLLIGLFLISLVGVGIWLLIPNLTEEPLLVKQKQPHPLKNKIAFVKSVFVKNRKITTSGGNLQYLSTFDTDIYLIKPDGTGETKVVDFDPGESVYISDLAWSSSGKYLGWLRKNSFEYVESSNLKGTAVSKVVSSKDNWIMRGFSFSPDENKVAILETLDMTSMVMRVIDLDNKKVVTEAELIKGKPKSDESVRAGSGHIDWLGPTTVVTVLKQASKFSISSFDLGEGFSSKKDVAVFTYFPDPFVVNSNTKKCYFWKHGKLGNELWISGLDGQDLEKLTNLSAGPNWPKGSSPTIYEMKISPNAKVLSYSSYIFEGSTLTTFDLKYKRLLKKLEAGSSFDWSSDSSKLAVLQTFPPSQLTNLLVIDLTGKQLTKLTNEGNPKVSYSPPAWFPQ
jgi:Tol biopolymer transport system component